MEIIKCGLWIWCLHIKSCLKRLSIPLKELNQADIKIAKAREEASASMAKKIATLQQQNEEQKRLREYRLRNN